MNDEDGGEYDRHGLQIIELNPILKFNECYQMSQINSRILISNLDIESQIANQWITKQSLHSTYN